jgi:hypothetical protein
MVDVLFFAGNLILMATQCYTGEFITRSGETIPEYTDVRGLADEVWAEYQAKVEVNAARMREGYDGVSTKCPICKREMRQPDEGQPYCLEHGLPGGAR